MAHPQFLSLLAGLILALICFVAAPLLAVIGIESGFLGRAILGVGIVVVGLRTVEWGAVLGYRIQRADGTLSGENLTRCLVMTGILVFSVGFMAAGVVGALSRVIR